MPKFQIVFTVGIASVLGNVFHWHHNFIEGLIPCILCFSLAILYELLYSFIIVELSARYYDKKCGIYYFIRVIIGEREANFAAAVIILRSLLALMTAPMYITACK